MTNSWRITQTNTQAGRYGLAQLRARVCVVAPTALYLSMISPADFMSNEAGKDFIKHGYGGSDG